MKKLFTLFATIAVLNSYSQVSINKVNAPADNSAILDISSTEKGLLIPRMTDSAKLAIMNPATGLMIYQTDNNPGFYYYSGTGWTSMSSNSGNTNQPQNWNLGNNRIYNTDASNGVTLSQGGTLSLKTTLKYATTVYNDTTFKVDSTGGLLLKSRLGFGTIPATGAGNRVMWHPYKGGFRAGVVDNNVWDDENFGFYSIGMGYNTMASSVASTAIGYEAVASGQQSTALGSYTVASAGGSTALGFATTSNAYYSTSMGFRTIAKGFASTVLGLYNDSMMTENQYQYYPSTPLLVIGNGNNSSERSNALVVQKDGRIYVDPSNKNTGTIANNGLMFGGANGTGEGISSKRTVGGNQYGLDFYTGYSSKMSISNTGNVGIGTNIPAAKLDVVGGNWDLTNTEGDIRLGNSTYKLKMGIALGGAGAGGVALIQQGIAGGNNVLSLGAQGTPILHVNGNNKTVGIGTAAADFPLTFANNLGNKVALWSTSPTQYYGMGIQNNLFQIFTDINASDIAFGYGSSTGFTETMRIKGNGNVGIGTTNASHRLTVAGNICATGSIGSCSDIRYKTNITPITQSLSRVLSIQGIYYNWKVDEYKDKGFTDERQIGFSAQEIEKLFPEMVKTDADGYKSVDYSRMTPVLVEAVKEQQKEIDEVKQQNTELMKKLENLEKLLTEKKA